MRPEDCELAGMIQETCESEDSLQLQLFIMLSNAELVKKDHQWFSKDDPNPLPKAENKREHSKDTELDPKLVREDLCCTQNAHSNANTSSASSVNCTL